MSNLKGELIEMPMMGGSSIWINPVTGNNIAKVMEILIKESETSKKLGKKQPKYTYTKLAKKTGIGRREIAYVCWILSFKETNYVRIKAVKLLTKRTIKKVMEVRLIKAP